MKGWLDKYNDGGPVQENYNDYSVSAPEGYVGVGTFNEGRDYSPAWGGQFQKGGKVPATRADSLALLNNTQALADYYKKNGYKKLEHYRDSDGEWNIERGYARIGRLENKQEKKPTEKRQKRIDKIRKKVTDIRESIDEDNRFHDPRNYLTNLNTAKQEFDKIRFDYDNDEHYGYTDEEGNYVAAKPSLEQYYTPIDANRFGQRDQSLGFMDLRAPMPLFDRRITPQNFVRYEIPEGRGYRNTVEFYGYAPLAVTPWNMIPPEQQQQRIQTYGTSGAPADILQQHPDWVAPTAAPEVKPKEQPKYRYTYGKPLFKGGPQTDYYTPIDENGNVINAPEFKTSPYQNGGNLPFINNPKLRNMLEGYKPGFMDTVGDYRLPEGYMAGSIYPSTEVSTSIGGEDGEPSYLIPSFKYAQPLQDPVQEFDMTGQHLGGPFKTWQDAEKFGELRHQYVEKGQPLPSPIATSNMAMGGSLPGATGSMYARYSGGGSMPGDVDYNAPRTGDIPSNGKYAKKTMASAQDGTVMPLTSNTEKEVQPVSPERFLDEEKILKNTPQEIISTGRSPYRFDMLKNAVMHDMAKEQSIPLDQVNKKEAKQRTKDLLDKREKVLKTTPIERVKGNGIRTDSVHGNIAGYFAWDKDKQAPVIAVSDSLNAFPFDEFKATARHEARHAYDYAGQLLTDYEKELINSKIDKSLQDNYRTAKAFDQIATPTEIVGRLQEIHGALRDSPEVRILDDSGFEKPTDSFGPKTHRYNPAQDKVKLEYLKSIQNNSGYQDLIRLMKPKDIVELMNTIAANNSQQGIPMAQDGLQLSGGEETQPVKTPAVKSEDRIKAEEKLVNSAPLDILEEGRSKFRFNMLQDAVKHDMAIEQGVGLDDVDEKEAKKRTKELLAKREAKLANPKVEFVKGNGTAGQPALGYYNRNDPNNTIALSDNLDKYGVEEFANTARHEFRHAYDDGGRYLTNYEKELISRKTNQNNVEKQKNLGINLYNYLSDPTEVTGRLQEIRGALKDNPRILEYLKRDPLSPDPYYERTHRVNKEGYYFDRETNEPVPVYKRYDAKKDKATYQDIHYLYEKIGPEKNSGLDDLLDIMKPEDIVELLNTIAANTPQQGMPMAQNGMEMSYYQNGLDFKPKGMGKNGKVIKDDRGQWAHPGEITQIGSNQITMKGVPYPVLGISDTGDTQMMYPNEEYEFIGDSVTEYPMMKQGGQLTKLNQLLNFTNYNTKQPGGWLDKYQ